MDRRTPRNLGIEGPRLVDVRKTGRAAPRWIPWPNVVGVAVLLGAMVVVAGFDTKGEAATRPSSTRSRANALVSPQAEIGEGVQVARPFVIERAAVSTGREATRGRAALALLRIRPAELYSGWTIAFRPARQGLLGMTLVDQRRVEIYVRLDRPLEGTAHDIAHELGHVTDVMYNDEDARANYLALRDRVGAPWWTCEACTDLQVGAGDFAETFARWAAPRFRFYSELAPEPNPEQLAAFAELLPEAVRANALLTNG